jgi:hypothetical protein
MGDCGNGRLERCQFTNFRKEEPDWDSGTIFLALGHLVSINFEKAFIKSMICKPDLEILRAQTMNSGISALTIRFKIK